MQQIVELIVIITPKTQSEKAIEILSQNDIDLQFMCQGKGTAGNAFADYFDLSDADKKVFFALTKKENASQILSTLDSVLNANKQKTVVFSLPLKSAMYSVLKQMGLAKQVERPTLSGKIKTLVKEIKGKAKINKRRKK